MVSFKSFFWGTICAFLEIGLFVFVLNLFSTYILGMGFMQVFDILDSFRAMMAVQASMSGGNSLLIFLTSRNFWQIMIFLGVLGIWFVNVAWQDRREDRQGGYQ